MDTGQFVEASTLVQRQEAEDGPNPDVHLALERARAATAYGLLALPHNSGITSVGEAVVLCRVYSLALAHAGTFHLTLYLTHISC